MHSSNIECLAKAVKELFDPRVGIINTIHEEKSLSNLSPFFHYSVRTCNTSAFCNQQNFQITRGVALSRERALAKAVGEGIERYCSAIYHKEHLPFYAYEEEKLNCIDPSEFLKYRPDLYEKKNFPWSEFNKSQKVRWTPAVEITNNNQPCYVPAAHTYLPYIYGAEKKIVQNISTGLACHSSYELAAITSICEVVERDAFMIFWRNRLSPPKIKIETLPNYLQAIIHEFNSRNQEVCLLDITTDIKIPTVLAILRCTIPGNPPFIISGSCKLSPELAILSALEELELTRFYCLNLSSGSTPSIDYKNYCDIKNQEDHMRFWAIQENLHLADFLFASKKQLDIKEMSSISPNTDLMSIVQIFSTLGLTVLLADLTTEDIINYGLRVTRAIIPKLHPLAFGYQNAEFVCDRLQTVPDHLGFNLLDSLNKEIPHPFP